MDDLANSKSRYLYLKQNGGFRRYGQTQNNESKAAGLAYNHGNMPAHGTYGALLFRPEWRAKREEILQRDNHTCIVCSKTSGLQVHHRQYHFVVQQNQFKLPWDYPAHLLVTLCQSCHNRGHKQHKVPTINI